MREGDVVVLLVFLTLQVVFSIIFKVHFHPDLAV